MVAAPSNLLISVSQIMGRAQEELRQLAMRSTNQNTKDRLMSKREEINRLQNRIMRANITILDEDPDVQKNIDKLTQLAGEAGAGVQEMRTATSAIKSATSFISKIEEILGLASIR